MKFEMSYSPQSSTSTLMILVASSLNWVDFKATNNLGDAQSYVITIRA